MNIYIYIYICSMSEGKAFFNFALKKNYCFTHQQKNGLKDGNADDIYMLYGADYIPAANGSSFGRQNHTRSMQTAPKEPSRRSNIIYIDLELYFFYLLF